MLLLMIGCHGRAREPATSQATSATQPASAPVVSYNLTTEIKPLDPRRATPLMFQVEVYQILLPFGAISRDEQFWKRVDEYAVDVATHDLLLKNGVRVGLLSEREMPRIKQLIEQNPTNVQRSTLFGADAKNAELEINRDVDFQNIFFFDDANQVQGRTFEHCRNSVTFSFEPAPRKAGTLRVSFCPVVRSIRRKMEFTAMNQEMEKDGATTERLYEMNLCADVPRDSVLVVAPSPDATRPSSIGQTFFTRPGLTQRQEYLIMVMARAVNGRVE